MSRKKGHNKRRGAESRARRSEKSSGRGWTVAAVAVLAVGLSVVAYVRLNGLWSGSSAGGEEGSAEAEVVRSTTPGTATEPGEAASIPTAAVPAEQGAPSAVETNAPAPRIEVPDDPVALVQIGNGLLDQGLVSQAIPYYHRARRLNPDDEEVCFNLGFAYGRIGMTNEAIQFYEASLSIYPDYVEAHNNLGNLYVEMRQFEKAMEHFAKALQVMPDHSSALNNLGKCLAAQGRMEDSVEKFAQAIRLNPDYLEARYNLGQAFMALGNYREALEEFNQALRIQPEFGLAQAGAERARALMTQSPQP